MSLELIGAGKHFLNETLSAQALRSAINKWDLMKLKIFRKVKDIGNQTNSNLQNGKRVLSTTNSIEG